MIQLVSFSAERSQAIYVPRAVSDMRDVLDAQIKEMASKGYFDFSVRWSGMTLMVEARGDELIIRREFDCFGKLLIEKVTDLEAGMARILTADGIEPVSEMIFEMQDDR